MRQKAHSWTSRFLSSAGKMVLLKSVLAVMLVYSMSCFKLLQSLVKQLQSVLTRFWWDLSPEIRKMCWVSWEKLSVPKSAGGLGFRKISQFNDAMLAKISWRILKSPNSLLAKILLGKYCHNAPLLNVGTTSGMSHGWRGILIGRDLLKKGLGWALGTGEKVNIWTEPWLSTDAPMAPIGPLTRETQEWTVNRLIDPLSKDWDINMVRKTLPQYEGLICNLIPSCFDLEDEHVWLLNASGKYTTKSGYATAKLCTGEHTSQNFKWKACIWNVKTSPKIQHFMWKATSKSLPVGSLLESRGIAVSPV